jgi:leucyl aminopeptidase
MQLSFAASNAAASPAGAVIVGALDGGALTPSAALLDKQAGGALSRALGFSKFTGKTGQMLELLAPAGVQASRIVMVGLGKGSDR